MIRVREKKEWKWPVFCSVCSRILGLLLLILFLLLIINQADDPLVYALLTVPISAVLIIVPCWSAPNWPLEKKYYQATFTFWCQNKDPKNPNPGAKVVPGKDSQLTKKGCPCDFVSFLYTACTGAKEKKEATAETTTEVKTKEQNPMGPKPEASNWRF
jgi:hypothetical protein